MVFGKVGSFSATLDLSSLDGSNGFKLTGVAAGDRSGSSVSAAGDVNGDGFDDLIIGAYRAAPNGSYSGASYVVFGKAGGFTANLDLSSLDGSNGFKLTGVAADDRSGRSVSAAGDVNGDGFADLIIGAPSADPNGNMPGRATWCLARRARQCHRLPVLAGQHQWLYPERGRDGRYRWPGGERGGRREWRWLRRCDHRRARG